MRILSTSKQPSRPAWTLERLVYEHSILLGMSIDASTHLSYTSALNSYLTFCKLHNFDINPTPETLSLYVMYQSTFINPKSIDSYLSRIANKWRHTSQMFVRIETVLLSVECSKAPKDDMESLFTEKIPYHWRISRLCITTSSPRLLTTTFSFCLNFSSVSMYYYAFQSYVFPIT